MAEVLTGLGSLFLGNQQNQQEQANKAKEYALLKQQFELDKERFGWDQETANREWNLRLQGAGINQESAKNYEESLAPAETRESSIQTATAMLDPLYNERMEQTLNDTNAGLMQRGFFGQAPGAELTNKNVAEVEKARNEAIINTANDLYQTSQDRYNQAKQFGISQFGQYGDVSQIDTAPVPTGPETPTAPGTPEVKLTPEGVIKQFITQRGITPFSINNTTYGQMLGSQLAKIQNQIKGSAQPGTATPAPTANVAAPSTNMAALASNMAAPQRTGNVAAPTSTAYSPNGNIAAPKTTYPNSGSGDMVGTKPQNSGNMLAPTLADMQKKQKQYNKGLML